MLSRFGKPVCLLALVKYFISELSMAEADVDLRGLESKEEGWFGKHFVCQWEKFEDNRPSLWNMAKWKIAEPDNTKIPDKKTLDKVLPIREVNLGEQPPENKIQVTWIGHATVLVQFEGISILSDPVFLDYCGPNRLMGYKRYRNAACEIKDIPKVDAVIISHNHYDHLETDAVKKISERFPDARWFVAKKQKGWLTQKGVDERYIEELDWWKDKKIEVNGKQFMFACTPSQHWCGRTPPLDINKCLWCSWVVKGPTKSYYFAGDTGYYDILFQAIGKKYGPFDLAALPIGAYHPRYITEYQHVDPEGAVKIHEDIKSNQSIAMHWGTFALTNEYCLEPPRKVAEEMEKRGHNPDKFISLCHGETWCLGEPRDESPFMKTSADEGVNSAAGNKL